MKSKRPQLAGGKSVGAGLLGKRKAPSVVSEDEEEDESEEDGSEKISRGKSKRFKKMSAAAYLESDEEEQVEERPK